PRHLGLSAFIVDMRAAGVTTRPITTITGSREFSEVYFDGVEVAEDQLLGELNEGMRVVATTLGFERSTNFLARVNAFREQVTEVTRLAHQIERNGRPAIDDAMIAD